MPEVPDNVDEALDALGDEPTTDEVFDVTRAFSARDVAAAAVGRGGDSLPGEWTFDEDGNLTSTADVEAQRFTQFDQDTRRVEIDNTLGIYHEDGNIPAWMFSATGVAVLDADAVERLSYTAAMGVPTLFVISDEAGNALFRIDSHVKLPSLPTVNPNVAGALWNDGGTVKISAG